jgi:hypothetical protein
LNIFFAIFAPLRLHKNSVINRSKYNMEVEASLIIQGESGKEVHYDGSSSVPSGVL